MKEYVERAAVHELVKRLPKYHMFSYDRTESLIGISPDDVDFGVDKIPAADVAPVRHGRWIKHEGYDECEACHAKAIYGSNYCPSCGALMDKEADHDKELL